MTELGKMAVQDLRRKFIVTMGTLPLAEKIEACDELYLTIAAYREGAVETLKLIEGFPGDPE